MFKPKLIPTLITIPLLIILLCLGTWQVKRLMWKNEIIAKLEQRLSLPAEELPSKITESELGNLEYRNFCVTGKFKHEAELHLYAGARMIRGKPGYMIFTPLERPKDHKLILINRGWVPESLVKPEDRTEYNPTGTTEICGIFMLEEKKGYFIPENDLEKNIFFYVSLKDANQFTKLNLEPYFINEAPSKKGLKFPITKEITANIRNDHLKYAIIWYSSALALLVIYILYTRKNS